MCTIIYRFIFCVGLLLFVCFHLHAQYPDNKWLLGYASFVEVNNGFGLVQLDFTNNQLSVGEEMEVVIDIDRNISIISTPAGDSILFYFNGLQVNNAAHELAVNGGDMYYGELSLGYDTRNGSFILPMPGTSNQYVLFSTYVIQDQESLEIYAPELNLSTISTSSSVEVIIKNETVASGQFPSGQLTATRHANGRDWWIIWLHKNSNRYLRFLLTPEGLQRLEDQIIGQAIISGAGAAHFSPDGRYYAMHNSISGTVGKYFDLFDFDRCTGLLSNHRQHRMDHYGGGTGLAISHDSRYLYISATLYIYQLDLWADDVFASIDTVAIYDGVQAPFSTAFNDAQLARDGKIYMSATGSMQKLHVMDYPNRQGAACNVRQRGIELPVYMSFGVPNFPFHRLGPLDGSACDTLGIDNVPLADFRSDQDSSDYLSFFFQNLSTYEPALWSWSFGDGSMSQDTSPVHTYAQGGSYEVCLTVSNEYGSDTSCDTLHLGMVNSAEAAAPQVEWQVFPNPAQDYFTFNLLDYYPREAYLELYNAVGQRVRRERVYAGWNTVEIGDLPSGVYSFVFHDSGKRLGSGKVVKVE
jgi:PKD repeat protein